MPSALITVIAGRYSGVYTPQGGGGLSLGILEEDGFEVSVQPKGEEINQSDAYGLSLLDFIFRGADWRCRYRGKEYGTSILQVLWPWGKGAQQLSPLMGVIGRRASDVAGSLVLTATTGSPAANSPATLTAGLCITSPNTNLPMNLTSRARIVPIEQVWLPYVVAGSDVGWFTTT